MKYLLTLHEAIDDDLIKEIKAAGVKINEYILSNDTYIKVDCKGNMGLRFNGDFECLGHASNAFYHSPRGSNFISGYTELNLEQFLELLGIKEYEPFEIELMQLLGG